MFPLRFDARITTPLKLLDPLEQEADLLVGEPVVRVLDLSAPAEQRVGLVEEEDPARWCSAMSNTRARFFSVSPMYFDTIRLRSIL